MTTNFARCGACSLAILCGSVSSTKAAESGAWMVFSGIANVRPNVSGGELSAPSLPGSSIDLRAASSVVGGLSYDLNDDWQITALILALPFKHRVVGAGTLQGAGDLATVKQLPLTLLARYKLPLHWAPTTPRPYVGAGITYGYFFSPKGNRALTALTNTAGAETTLTVKSNFGATVQVGAQFELGDGWSMDASVLKSFIKTSASLSTGQTTSLRLDPLTGLLTLGRRF